MNTIIPSSALVSLRAIYVSPNSNFMKMLNLMLLKYSTYECHLMHETYAVSNPCANWRPGRVKAPIIIIYIQRIISTI